jgi:ATP-dependent DNA helicase RecG
MSLPKEKRASGDRLPADTHPPSPLNSCTLAPAGEGSIDAEGGDTVAERRFTYKMEGRDLSDEVQYLKGVGPGLAQVLAKLNIITVGDLLRHIPRRHEDRTNFRRISDIRHGELATIHGQVMDASLLTTKRKGFTVTKVLLGDGSGMAQLVFFQQPYLQKSFKLMATEKRWIVVFGQAKRSGYGPIEMERAEWEEVDGETDPLATNRIVPVYALTEGLYQKRIRRVMDSVLQLYPDYIEEFLPTSVVKQFRLESPPLAWRNIHFPSSNEALERARRRLVFEEFFLLQVGLARRRAAVAHEGHGHKFTIGRDALNAELASVAPFKLTGAQERAIAQIHRDVTTGRAMNRLVQGDVGSGKTLIAVAAILMAVRSGFQAALMAPTEILAQQHALVLRRLLEPIGISVELAIGSNRESLKKDVRERLAGGQSHVAVGTHALIQEGVEFRRLGLAIVDEQHRFGVLQRQALHRKGERPHVLVMTATPIPRTLTMTLYGDLDTTIIDELPPGRKPIKTHWKTRTDANNVYGNAAKLLAEGRQLYVVCPLVEESDKLQAKAATQLAEHIARDIYPNYRVGLLHGQMKSEEKDEVMRRFKAHALDVLVATTVIEVGIDVPNASVIIIEDADRFGLAQLHQLRGRVGRGEHASYCILVADPKTEDGRARMQVMAETNDGFRIAEEDLKLRGPGEFFGTRQSGLPELYVGDILRDHAVMDETRQAAFALIERDPNLAHPENYRLRKALEKSVFGFETVA